MKYTLFGKTGLRVSQLALGTGNFGAGWGHGADADTSRASLTIDRFVNPARPLTWEGVGVFFIKDAKIKEWHDYTIRTQR